MNVKAKMVCHNVEEHADSKTAHLMAVTTGSEENKSFAKYTPSANLSINISNEASASGFFESGKEYYLIFEKAE